ncbi:MAG: PQQ-binding-like beta-propeller repeat protein [Planctomycetes bacterium]|nr:PQQ-binding-like beta-propeller repeat protein [Planctomycetota bacterium]
MFFLPDLPLTLAVFPVLVGPLQTLLALLPAILIGVGSMLFAVFKPGGFVKLLRFCWRQRLFLGTVAGIIVVWQYGVPSRLFSGQSSRPRGLIDGNGANTELVLADPTAPDSIWINRRDETVLSTPVIVGDQVIFSTATDIGPFSPTGRGAIVCVDAHSGHEIWRYAPDNYRATFSSPVVWQDVVVCGEGLHQVDDARVTCLDRQTGLRRWEFRTNSHVEATPAIADGRVFIGAGGDGFYCLAIEPDATGKPNVLWHLEASDFADCESSPVVHEGVVYFGLGEGGSAVCAVQAESGRLLWKLTTPYPVFASPTIADGKLLIATGNGNYVQSAADLLAMKLLALRDDDATPEQLAVATERYRPVGEVWCIDLGSHALDWKFTTSDAILGKIVPAANSFYFGSRDGHMYGLSKSGKLETKYNVQDPIISSPALGTNHLYCSTVSGRLYCLDRKTLKPVWDRSLGRGETFTSSPVVAYGHVYIGTAQQGLSCLGRPGVPAPSQWVRGDRGGNVDGVPVADPPEILWQFPGAGAEPIQVTAPLMLLDDSLYVATEQANRFALVCLRLSGSAPSAIWSQSFEQSIVIAPVGCGTRICVVEGDANALILKLHCLSTTDGRPLWTTTIAAPTALTPGSTLPPAGISLDPHRVYAWTSEDRLGCFDLATGKTVWDQCLFEVGTPRERTRGRGVPASTEDLLFSCVAPTTGAGPMTLIAQDAVTGVALWQASLKQEPTAGPIVEGTQILVPAHDQFDVYNVVDGAFVETRSNPELPLTPASADEVGQPVTPLISRRGRIYYATDRGRIVCLGGGQP